MRNRPNFIGQRRNGTETLTFLHRAGSTSYTIQRVGSSFLATLRDRAAYPPQLFTTRRELFAALEADALA